METPIDTWTLLVTWILLERAVAAVGRAVAVLGAILVVAAAGAAGGLLFSLSSDTNRTDWKSFTQDLRSRRFPDCAFGIGGSFVIFLITPNLSENVLGLSAAAAEIDWIEIIAVALVGGYAGRGIMEKAGEQLAQVRKDIEEAKNQATTARTAVADLKDAVLQSDRAMARLLAHLDLDDDPVSEGDLREAVATLSQPNRGRLYLQAKKFFKGHTASTESKRAAERVKPVLIALVELDDEKKFHEPRELLAQAFGELTRWQEAELYIQRAIESRDAYQVKGFIRYEEYQARCLIEQNRDADEIRRALAVFKLSPGQSAGLSDKRVRAWVEQDHDPNLTNGAMHDEAPLPPTIPGA